MLVKDGVVLAGLHPIMRKVLKVAEDVYKKQGRAEGVTITSTTDGVHSAGSWHPYGFAVDLRTRYFSEAEKNQVGKKLKLLLSDYDVIVESTHIHIEIGNALAARLGVLYD